MIFEKQRYNFFVSGEKAVMETESQNQILYFFEVIFFMKYQKLF